MKTNTAREVATSRAQNARQRKAVAQHCCNQLGNDLVRAFDGYEYRDYFLSGALTPLSPDLLHRLRLSAIKQDRLWKPPKGALEGLAVAIQALVNWKIPRGAHAGERYAGIHAPLQVMADVAGCHVDTWARAALPWLEEMQLFHAIPTQRVVPPGWRTRTGAAMPHCEGRFFYVLGDAALDLLDRREQRIARSRLRSVALAKRDLRLSRDRKKPDPKAPEKSSLPEKTFSGRARGSVPLAHRLAKIAQRPRRKGRPAAAAPSPVTNAKPAVMSPAQAGDASAVDTQRLATREAPCEARPASLEAQRKAPGDAPTDGNAPRCANDSDAEHDERERVRSLLEQLDPQRARRDRERAPAAPAAKPIGMQGVRLPPSAGELVSSLSRGGNTGGLIRVLQATAQQAKQQGRPRPRDRTAADTPPAARAPRQLRETWFELEERSPEEREENERRRAVARRRAEELAEQLGREQPHEDVDDNAGDVERTGDDE